MKWYECKECEVLTSKHNHEDTPKCLLCDELMVLKDDKSSSGC